MKKITQSDVIVKIIEKLKIATIGLITQVALKDNDFVYTGKTPEANIRRILQLDDRIYKIIPGQYSLKKFKEENDKNGNAVIDSSNINDPKVIEKTHYFYQSLIIEIGNSKKFETYCPNQDKNQKFNDTNTLQDLRTISKIPEFSYPFFVKRISTVDVTWFDQNYGNLMPKYIFEVEHSTDIYNSLLKFVDLNDFNTKMIIVADNSKQNSFNEKMKSKSFEIIKERVKFLSYDDLAKWHTSVLLSSL